MKRPLPDYQIGDVVPVPADADITLAQVQMAKRGLLARNSQSAHRSIAGITAKRIMAGLNEADAYAGQHTAESNVSWANWQRLLDAWVDLMPEPEAEKASG